MRYGFPAMFYKNITAGLFFVILCALTPAMAADAPEQKPLTLVAFGDSLTAGYMLPPGTGFAEQLQQALRDKGHEGIIVVNAGVSGDTSSGGLARLDWAVGPEADAVIVELGANDALRGIDPAITRESLTEIISRLKTRNLPVLLAGMYAPPNLGRDYGESFNSIYPELAEKEELILYPFFLDGVAGERRLNLGDGIHPTEEGVAIIVTRILPYVENLIDVTRKRQSDEN